MSRKTDTPYSGDPFFEKGLPQVVEMERSILGAGLLEPICVDQAAELLRREDFFLDSHRRIFEKMVALRAENSPVDLMTLAEALRRDGEFEQIGGATYISSLIDGVPRTDTIEPYAKKVIEKSMLRAEITAANQIIMLAFEEEDSAIEIAGKGTAMMHAIIERAASSKWEHVGDIAHRKLEQIEQMAGRPEMITGIPTGFTDFDRMTSGLQKQELTVIAARPSMGKAQALDSKLMTPHGFITMRDVKVGDKITGPTGLARIVIGVFPQGEKELFQIEFTDGGKTECCMEHLWFTQTHNERRRGLKGSVKTTKQIALTLRGNSERLNHAIPVTAPIEFAEREAPLLLHPYCMGLLLGDGTFGKCISFDKPEIDLQTRLADLLPPEDAITPHEGGLRIRRAKRNNKISRTKEILQAYSLDGCDAITKFIPTDYLLNTVQARLELLRGLCDTDGHITESGKMTEFGSSSKRLADDVTFLARSLGGIVATNDRVPHYTYRGEQREGHKAYRLYISFPSGLCPVSSQKHLAKWKGGTGRKFYRRVESVTSMGLKHCQCILLDSIDHLYLTDDFIVTHNTALALNIAQYAAKNGSVVGIFSLEMSAMQLIARLLCSEARVDAHRLRTGYLNREEWARLADGLRRLTEQQIYIEDAPHLPPSIMRAKCRQLQSEKGLDLLIIDYLQLMGSDLKMRDYNRQQEVSANSGEMKTLAKELDIPVIALSQLSRAPEQRSDHKPQLSDLRESGSIEQDSDNVVFIYRDEMYNPTDENQGKAQLIIAKQRNGPTGDVELAWLREFTRFENMWRE